VLWAVGFRPQRNSVPDAPAEANDEIAEADRGRAASTPSEIPVRGWKDILLRVYQNISRHHLIAIAAGVTFYSLLAIFPAIAALVALYGLFADPGTIATQLDNVSGFLPGGAIDILRDQMTRVASQGGGKLGITFVVGLGASLWSANAGMKSLFEALNIVYGEDEKRGLIKLNAVSLAFTVGGLLFALAALAAIVVLPVALQYIGIESAAKLLMQIVRWPALLIVIALWLAAIYRFGPSRETAQWRWVTWGAPSLRSRGLSYPVFFPGTPQVSARSIRRTALSAR
jgi:membrane protein